MTLEASGTIVDGAKIQHLRTLVQGEVSRQFGRVPKKNVTKTDIYWGSHHIHILVVLTSL